LQKPISETFSEMGFYFGAKLKIMKISGFHKEMMRTM